MPRHFEGRALRLANHSITPDMVRRSARPQGPGGRPSSAPAETASRGRGPSQPDPASTGNSGAPSTAHGDADSPASRGVFPLGWNLRTNAEKPVLNAARQHFEEHKWVVLEEFVSERFVEAMLKAESTVQHLGSYRVEKLDFMHDGVSSKREMIQHRYGDTPKECLEMVDRRLARLGFYSPRRMEPERSASHVRFRPTILVSLPHAPRQHIHADFKHAGPSDDPGKEDGPPSLPHHFGVLIALQDGTRLLHGVTGEEIEIPRRGAIIFRGDFPHAGASYAKRNVCFHLYYIRGWPHLPIDSDGKLVVYLEEELEAKQRDRESAAQGLLDLRIRRRPSNGDSSEEPRVSSSRPHSRRRRGSYARRSEGGEDLFAGAERLSGVPAERRFRVKRRFRRSEGGEGLLGLV